MCFYFIYSNLEILLCVLLCIQIQIQIQIRIRIRIQKREGRGVRALSIEGVWMDGWMIFRDTRSFMGIEG